MLGSCSLQLPPELQLNGTVAVDVSGLEDRLLLSLLPPVVHFLHVIQEGPNGAWQPRAQDLGQDLVGH